MPPSSPSVSFKQCFHFAATCSRTRTASRVTSVPMPSPGRTRTFRSMPLVRRHADRLFAALPDQRDDLLVHEALLAMVGYGREPVVEGVQLFAAQLIAQILAALVERVAAAVFSENQLPFRHADR